jgi:hypothetical protein
MRMNDVTKPQTGFYHDERPHKTPGGGLCGKVSG